MSDDLFESVISLEEDLQQRGRIEGVEHGGKLGYAEGYVAGREKGSSAGSEIGFMVGLCETALSKAEEYQLKARTVKAVQALLDSIRSFPFADPSYDNYVEDFEKIRNKFRHVCALLKVTQSHTESLSF
eukprot:scpid94114/ scgid7779/ Oral cancer-overexpressed protein 1; Tumor-amplified and overexpressed sequence 1